MGDEHLITLQPGTLISGKYEVVKCLGAGSMGLVYACRHRELQGHMVAIKVLFPEVARDKTSSARFRNEIFASYGVSHTNVVRAYEYIRDGDLIAYTMEFVNGGDLASKLGDPDKKIPIPEIIFLLSQMCAGVQAIHDAGIVHRDLKPENILLTKEGNVKIADFGIARTGYGPKLTEHGGVVGTIDYVSPEYMMNSQVDSRSDIYALGVLGYEMITGEPPFRGDSVYATMTKRLKSDPEPPSSKRSDSTPELDNVILKAMARDPEKRYQTAAEMFDDLRELISDTPLVKKDLTRSIQRPSVVTHRPQESSLSQSMPSKSPEELSHQPTVALQSFGGTEFGMGGVISSPDSDRTTALGSNSYEFSTSTGTEGGIEDTTGTRDFHPELNRLASHYEDRDETINVNQYDRREIKPLVTGGWNPGSKTPSIVFQADNQKLQRLSNYIDKVSRPIWIDVVILVLAILIGVGVGVQMLKFIRSAQTEEVSFLYKEKMNKDIKPLIGLNIDRV